VIADDGLDSLRRTRHARRFAIDVDVVALLLLALEHLDARVAARRRDRLERDFEHAVTIDLTDVEIVAGLERYDETTPKPMF
jgi:hypothetical protein